MNKLRLNGSLYLRTTMGHKATLNYTNHSRMNDVIELITYLYSKGLLARCTLRTYSYRRKETRLSVMSSSYDTVNCASCIKSFFKRMHTYSTEDIHKFEF